MKFTRSKLAIPYIIYMIIFVVLPLFVVCYYAFTGDDGSFTFENFTDFFTNSKTIGTLFYSAVIAVVTTICCLLIAYPTAFVLAKGNFKRSDILLIVFVMPMWINFTLRVTALKEVLNAIEGNLAYYPFFNSVLAMTYDFMPFMIMPIYASLTKLDDQIVEAAADLGAKQWQIMLKIVIPMSMPGIISGITMVFLPAMTNYVVLDMVYNSTFIMGSLIGSYFSSYDWHNGSMISMILLMLIVIITFISSKLSKENLERKESVGI